MKYFNCKRDDMLVIINWICDNWRDCEELSRNEIADEIYKFVEIES